MLLEEHVPVITTGAGMPDKYMKEWVPAGIKVVPVVPSVAIARPRGALRRDCGNRRGRRIWRSYRRNVHNGAGAAGRRRGEHPGYRLRAALPTDAAWRRRSCWARRAFRWARASCAPRNASTHENYKEKVLKARDIDTIVTGRRLGHPVRALKNPFTNEFAKLEYDASKTNEEVEQFGVRSTAPRSRRGRRKAGQLPVPARLPDL